MAIKIPLVLSDSCEIERLQPGDNIQVNANQMTRTFTSTALPGEAVYVDGAGSVDLAQANAAGTSCPIGLAAEGVTAAGTGAVTYEGELTLTTGEWDAITGQTGGLTPGAKYFLSSAAAGNLVPQASLPALAQGNYCVQVGIACDTTTMIVEVKDRILL